MDDEILAALMAQRLLLDEAERNLESQIDAAERAQMAGDPERERLTMYIRDLYREQNQLNYQLGRLDSQIQDRRLLVREQAENRSEQVTAKQFDRDQEPTIREPRESLSEWREQRQKVPTEHGIEPTRTSLADWRASRVREPEQDDERALERDRNK